MQRRYVMFLVWSSELEWVAAFPPLCSCSNELFSLSLALSSAAASVWPKLISAVHFFSKILQFYILILSQPQLLSLLTACPPLCNFPFLLKLKVIFTSWNFSTFIFLLMQFIVSRVLFTGLKSRYAKRPRN